MNRTTNKHIFSLNQNMNLWDVKNTKNNIDDDKDFKYKSKHLEDIA